MVDAGFYPAIWITTLPATSSAPGKKGQMYIDSSFLYLCIADNQWKRITLEAF